MSEKFPDTCKVAKLKLLYKKVSLNQPCICRPISLLPLLFKVIVKVIHDQTTTFLNSKHAFINLVFEKSILRIFAFLT